MNNQIRDLKNELSTLKDKLVIFKTRDEYVGNEFLDKFHYIFSKIDDLNKNLFITNKLMNEYYFYSILDIEQYLKSQGFSKHKMKAVNEPYNYEVISSDETPEVLRNVEFSKIQKAIDKLVSEQNEKYFLFNPNKRTIKEITTKELINLIKVVEASIN